MNNWVIEAERLSKTFAWMPVLSGVSCRIGRGEIVGIFGHNGAGKTTLLRLFATLLRPSAGTLKLFHHDPRDAQVRRRVGFLGHDSFLYPDLTPVENLTFYGRAYGLPQLAARIDAALERVGLQGWGHIPVRAFSRGMEQRLGLARALFHDPDLLLLDEPDTGLDPQGTALLRVILAQARSQGKTVVFTTHDPAFGLAVCTRVLILHGGVIVWQASGNLPSVETFGDIYARSTQSASRMEH
ncbi:MAG: heme ABC exporter ATP-binding protein CcmA [Candidatus Binatia bacterium]|nr:heme ABC exporter ATP-binding protein CcmA [Candidatus Binatia bacterium]